MNQENIKKTLSDYATIIDLVVPIINRMAIIQGFENITFGAY